MSKNKRGSGADELYRNHLLGTHFQNNPTNNRFTLIQRMYMRLLTELSANRFNWVNMPDSVDVRFMELTLFYRALAVFYFDEDFDKYLVLEAGSSGFMDLMQNPNQFTTIGNEYISKTLGAYQPHKKDQEGYDAKRKAIPIWSNYVRVPDWDIIQIYSERLAEMDLTIENNAKNARVNLALITNENTKLSGVNIVRELQTGSNIIHINADGPMADMNFLQPLVLNTDLDGIEKLHIVRTRMWNECMGLLGINNANQDKKERVVSSEVSANDMQTAMMRQVNLNARKQAAGYINDVFGLGVEVDYYNDEPVEPPAPLTQLSQDNTDSEDE